MAEFFDPIIKADFAKLQAIENTWEKQKQIVDKLDKTLDDMKKKHERDLTDIYWVKNPDIEQSRAFYDEHKKYRELKDQQEALYLEAKVLCAALYARYEHRIGSHEILCSQVSNLVENPIFDMVLGKLDQADKLPINIDLIFEEVDAMILDAVTSCKQMDKRLKEIQELDPLGGTKRYYRRDSFDCDHQDIASCSDQICISSECNRCWAKGESLKANRNNIMRNPMFVIYMEAKNCSTT
jgi:hypothetical protein